MTIAAEETNDEHTGIQEINNHDQRPVQESRDQARVQGQNTLYGTPVPIEATDAAVSPPLVSGLISPASPPDRPGTWATVSKVFFFH